jgi:hypothetical protein
VIAFIPVLVGTFTFSSTVPLEHGSVAGSPTTGLFEVNVQLVALVTLADKVTAPPDEPSEGGVAAKEETVGFAGLAPIAAATAVDQMDNAAATAPTPANIPMCRFVTISPPGRL